MIRLQVRCNAKTIFLLPKNELNDATCAAALNCLVKIRQFDRTEAISAVQRSGESGTVLCATSPSSSGATVQ